MPTAISPQAVRRSHGALGYRWVGSWEVLQLVHELQGNRAGQRTGTRAPEQRQDMDDDG